MATEPTEELSMQEAIAAFTGTADETADANSDDDLDEDSEVSPEDGQAETDDEQDGESADDLDEEESDLDEDGQADDETDTDEDDEEDAGAGKFVAHDRRVKLPDGSFATVSDLIQGNLRDKDYRQKTMAHAEEVKSFASTRESVTKRDAEVTQQLEYTQALIASVMPQAPTPPNVAYAQDPVAWGEYNVAKQNYDYFQQHAQHIQSQLDGRKAETEAKAKGDRDARLQSSWEELTQAAPELKEPKNLEALVNDIKEYGALWGIPPERLGELPLNPQEVLIFRKAVAWDKLQAKNKAAKAPTVPAEKRPPVQKGGKRLNGAEIRNRESKAAMDRLNKTGSIRDGVAAYLASQSEG